MENILCRCFCKNNKLHLISISSGIGTGIHYPIPVHLQPAFSELGHTRGDFPHSERAADEVLSLPMFPEITCRQQEQVVEAVASWCNRRSS